MEKTNFYGIYTMPPNFLRFKPPRSPAAELAISSLTGAAGRRAEATAPCSLKINRILPLHSFS